MIEIRYKTFFYVMLLSALIISCTNKGSLTEKSDEICNESALLDRKAPYHGIDISNHNKLIDWAEVSKDRNIRFVYIKATEGATYVDKRYKENVQEARNYGIKVGSYHYFRMTSSPQEQLKNMISQINKDDQDLIPMVDVETTDRHSVAETRDSLMVFLKLVEQYYGVKPMIYGTNKSYNGICGQKFNLYPLYLGRYGNNPPRIKGQEHYTIWQFSEHGHISGITTEVDLCKFHDNCDLSNISY